MVQSTTLTLGMDIGDRFTQFCLLPVMGEDPVEEGRVATTPAGISEFLGGRPRCRVVFEVGCHSPWINDLAEEAGHEVFVANPRELAFIYGNNRKSDRVDAERLARVGRLDPKLLSPIHHRGKDARRDLLVLRVRDALVSERSKLVNTVRGLVKSTGHRIKSCSTVCFARTARESLPADLAEPLAPLLDSIEQISGRIRELDRKAEELCARKYPETAVLRQIHGVGVLTALAYVLILESPERFKKSRDVGAYLGMVPRRDQSGDTDRQLRITKAGDSFLRRLLVQSSQYILGHFGRDSDLRRRGLALADRGGKAAKKRAVVATARKLAVLLHALWKTGEEYQPLRNSPPSA